MENAKGISEIGAADQEQSQNQNFGSVGQQQLSSGASPGQPTSSTGDPNSLNHHHAAKYLRSAEDGGHKVPASENQTSMSPIRKPTAAQTANNAKHQFPVIDDDAASTGNASSPDNTEMETHESSTSEEHLVPSFMLKQLGLDAPKKISTLLKGPQRKKPTKGKTFSTQTSTNTNILANNNNQTTTNSAEAPPAPTPLKMRAGIPPFAMPFTSKMAIIYGMDFNFSEADEARALLNIAQKLKLDISEDDWNRYFDSPREKRYFLNVGKFQHAAVFFFQPKAVYNTEYVDYPLVHSGSPDQEATTRRFHINFLTEEQAYYVLQQQHHLGTLCHMMGPGGSSNQMAYHKQLVEHWLTSNNLEGIVLAAPILYVHKHTISGTSNSFLDYNTFTGIRVVASIATKPAATFAARMGRQLKDQSAVSIHIGDCQFQTFVNAYSLKEEMKLIPPYLRADRQCAIIDAPSTMSLQDIFTSCQQQLTGTATISSIYLANQRAGKKEVHMLFQLPVIETLIPKNIKIGLTYAPLSMVDAPLHIKYQRYCHSRIHRDVINKLSNPGAPQPTVFSLKQALSNKQPSSYLDAVTKGMSAVSQDNQNTQQSAALPTTPTTTSFSPSSQSTDQLSYNISQTQTQDPSVLLEVQELKVQVQSLASTVQTLTADVRVTSTSKMQTLELSLAAQEAKHQNYAQRLEALSKEVAYQHDQLESMVTAYSTLQGAVTVQTKDISQVRSDVAQILGLLQANASFHSNGN